MSWALLSVLAAAVSEIRPFFVLIFTAMLSIFWPKILKEDVCMPGMVKKVVSTDMMFAGMLLVV
jgi:hypothetical protein